MSGIQEINADVESEMVMGNWILEFELKFLWGEERDNVNRLICLFGNQNSEENCVEKE